jgi:tRNA-splicing ligase RtcB
MKYYNDENALVIKSWCNNPEDGAINQAKNLARLPFAFKQICLMPDTHQGYGMPIGGVLATEKVIIPNAVGVDIGCGMCAVQTPWITNDITTEQLKKILVIIRELIPVGFNKHQSPRDEGSLPMILGLPDDSIVLQEYYNARLSVGTLGGGNHFIEIQKDESNAIWIMVHSGSRNLGYKVANYYNNLAVELTGKWYSYVPKEWQLAFLPIDTFEGDSYIKEMQYCVDFSFANRKLMLDRICNAFHTVLQWERIDLSKMINISHNYARLENHFGKNVMVHRKGATSARLQETGLIPGSQGTASYVVSGKGNPESFESCSHGAGRSMGRKEAERTLNLKNEQKKMDDRGILHSVQGTNDLDEAPGAYKDISIVMAEQADLVDILVKLEPLAVVKG